MQIGVEYARRTTRRCRSISSTAHDPAPAEPAARLTRWVKFARRSGGRSIRPTGLFNWPHAPCRSKKMLASPECCGSARDSDADRRAIRLNSNGSQGSKFGSDARSSAHAGSQADSQRSHRMFPEACQLAAMLALERIHGAAARADVHEPVAHQGHRRDLAQHMLGPERVLFLVSPGDGLPRLSPRFRPGASWWAFGPN